MSKRRDLRTRTFFQNSSVDEQGMKHSSSFWGNAQAVKSRYIPSLHKNSSIDLSATNYHDFHKEKLFNKNISYYRQNFNQNDSSQLPFMSSLRKVQSEYRKSNSKARNESTVTQPFSAGEKTTANMTLKKKISDLHGKAIRMTNAFYRWHNRSGVNNKQGTNFQCSLRDYNKTWAPNPEEEKFDNLIKPLRYEDVEPAIYTDKEIICPRQRKIFKLQSLQKNKHKPLGFQGK